MKSKQPGTYSLAELRDEVLQDLQDDLLTTPKSQRVWSQEEIEKYLRDGYQELVKETQAIWDTIYLDSLPFAANYSFGWERKFFALRQRFYPTKVTVSQDSIITQKSSHDQVTTINDESAYEVLWEREFAESGNGPGNHDFTFERGYLITTYIGAVVQLPESTLKVERVTNNNIRIDPYPPRELQEQDARYEDVTGNVEAYVQGADGLRSLRKYRRPATSSEQWSVFGGPFGLPRATGAMSSAGGSFTLRMHLDQFAMVFSGLLDGPISVFGCFHPGIGISASQSLNAEPGAWSSVGEFANAEVLTPHGDFRRLTTTGAAETYVANVGGGFLRRVPGYHPEGGPWGIARRISPSLNNVKAEVTRLGFDVENEDAEFELPRHYCLYLRNYALHRAFKRRGPGQDLHRSTHYAQRFTQGFGRIKRRMIAIDAMRTYVMGGDDPNAREIPKGRAGVPWNFVPIRGRY